MLFFFFFSYEAALEDSTHHDQMQDLDLLAHFAALIHNNPGFHVNLISLFSLTSHHPPYFC